ncbi:hypothetical protein FOZG_17758 [Fusarium oxysporum Fo47]|uniref:Uncharacterized protein n=1 Tax=Fusarium oxysporum Fo47 TaxID=660027 RepID=W9J9K3_FUSOX|nr:hypothetical protein FOZG_17758 [Fusarium oxysporum Fo47]
MLVIGGIYANASEKMCPDHSRHTQYELGQTEPKRCDPGNVVLIDIRTAIGGSSTSGATKTTPASGFDAPDFAVLMERTAVSGTRTARRSTETSTKKPPSPPSSSSKPSSSLSTGATAGIAVGCSVVFILALAGCGLIYRRRKFYSQSHSVAPPPPHDDMSMTCIPSPGPSQDGWGFSRVSPLSGTTPSYDGQQAASPANTPA